MHLRFIMYLNAFKITQMDMKKAHLLHLVFAGLKSG